MPWDPTQYHQFQAQRAAPFYDLLDLVKVADEPNEGLRVVDLGCGTGELTRALADHLPGSTVVGLDSSTQMLEKAAAHARPGLTFEQGTLQDLDGDWDLIFSNAAIQWVDDHPRLIASLWERLVPGGQMVIQQPSNHYHFTHRAIRQLAEESPYREQLQGWNRLPPVLPMDDYAEMFYGLGANEITIFEKIYPHILENADAMIEWVSGTALVPYFERLGDLREPFVQELRVRTRERFPGTPVFYGFRRMLFAASKPEEI